MKRFARVLVWSTIGLSLTGCVAQEKYNALKLERDRFKEQLDAAQAEALAARAERDSLKHQLDALLGAGNNKDSLISNLTQQKDELERQLAELNRKYGEAMNRPTNAGEALPTDLSAKLKELAAQYPDLIEYDAARGVVRFKSDVTFASGDAALNPRAKSVIDQFAEILKSPAAQGFEYIVAGHTDNVRVTNPATIRAGHKDNWYLSAHRAISVGEELMHQGVPANEIAVTGYADEHPIASNSTAEGRQENRRVEVLILPQTVKLAPSGGNEAGAAESSSDNTAPAAAPVSKRPAVKKKAAAPTNQ